MTRPSLTAIILTYNEEKHLQRSIDSLKEICERIIIVDSFSTDKTKEIAFFNEVDFFQNNFVNQANQINWALENIQINTNWIIRVDSDEYLTEELQKNIKKSLKDIDKDISAIRVKRLMYFLGKPLKKGGMYPIWHLRIWRANQAICEQRWMDERMVIKSGKISNIEGDLVDHNLNKLTWWTQKHNNYATREAIDILDKLYKFSTQKEETSNFFGKSEERRRWLKLQYLKLPLFVRPILFWFIRYFIQGGFLEGKRGFIWNALQCGWYRFLVDAKIYEAYKYSGKDKNKLITFFKKEYGYDVTKVG